MVPGLRVLVVIATELIVAETFNLKEMTLECFSFFPPIIEQSRDMTEQSERDLIQFISARMKEKVTNGFKVI